MSFIHDPLSIISNEETFGQNFLEEMFLLYYIDSMFKPHNNVLILE